MNIKYEYLELIPELLDEIKSLKQNASTEKRWLNINEASTYLGYSKDYIHKLKDDEFFEGTHYFKKGKLLFDRLELDNWVTDRNSKVSPKQIVSQILKDII